jgi:xylulokinase
LFIPDLVGSGPPQPDPFAWGAWLGMRIDIDRQAMARAALEGLSFRIRQMLDEMVRVSEHSVQNVRCVGGGTRSAWLQQLKCNVFGMPLETLNLPEATAQGAAMLAGVGAGIYANISEAPGVTQQAITRYTPDDALRAYYDEVYRKKYLPAYAQLKKINLD